VNLHRTRGVLWFVLVASVALCSCVNPPPGSNDSGGGDAQPNANSEDGADGTIGDLEPGEFVMGTETNGTAVRRWAFVRIG